MLLSLVFACTTDKPVDREPVLLQQGAPVAGVAEGIIDAPVGTPLGGYSSRCDYMGGSGLVGKPKG